ncbi:MAG: hypothetical protein ACFFB0_08445 [Promethearchaeota archaeon]
MQENKTPLKDKIMCPICNFKFIPDSFHFEKTHFDTEENKGELTKILDETHQVIINPFTAIRGSWVTYCPECRYIIKFAAEIGKKERADDAHRILKRGLFEEFGKEYKYNYNISEKPYMDKSDYFIEKVDNIKRKIKLALDEINFEHWGTPYKEWKNSKAEDSFKFVIHFFSNLEDYINSNVEDFKIREMPEKIKALNLHTELEDLIHAIRDLKDKIAHDVYELTEEEEEVVDKTFIEFIYYLIKKQLKPLNLDAIQIKPEYNFIDINDINYEIREFLNVYLNKILHIEDFYYGFLTPLLKDLGMSII